MDINLLKAERPLVVPLADHGLQQFDNNVAQESPWVTYQYSTVHPILRWLPLKLAEWIAESMLTTLGLSYRFLLRRKPSGQ